MKSSINQQWDKSRQLREVGKGFSSQERSVEKAGCGGTGSVEKHGLEMELHGGGPWMDSRASVPALSLFQQDWSNTFGEKQALGFREALRPQELGTPEQEVLLGSLCLGQEQRLWRGRKARIPLLPRLLVFSWEV